MAGHVVRLKQTSKGNYDVTKGRAPTGYRIQHGDPDEPNRWIVFQRSVASASGNVRLWSYPTRADAKRWVEDELLRNAAATAPQFAEVPPVAAAPAVFPGMPFAGSVGATVHFPYKNKEHTGVVRAYKNAIVVASFMPRELNSRTHQVRWAVLNTKQIKSHGDGTEFYGVQSVRRRLAARWLRMVSADDTKRLTMGTGIELEKEHGIAPRDVIHVSPLVAKRMAAELSTAHLSPGRTLSILFEGQQYPSTIIGPQETRDGHVFLPVVFSKDKELHYGWATFAPLVRGNITAHVVETSIPDRLVDPHWRRWGIQRQEMDTGWVIEEHPSLPVGVEDRPEPTGLLHIEPGELVHVYHHAWARHGRLVVKDRRTGLAAILAPPNNKLTHEPSRIMWAAVDELDGAESSGYPHLGRGFFIRSKVTAQIPKAMAAKVAAAGGAPDLLHDAEVLSGVLQIDKPTFEQRKIEKIIQTREDEDLIHHAFEYDPHPLTIEDEEIHTAERLSDFQVLELRKRDMLPGRQFPVPTVRLTDYARNLFSDWYATKKKDAHKFWGMIAPKGPPPGRKPRAELDEFGKVVRPDVGRPTPLPAERVPVFYRPDTPIPTRRAKPAQRPPLQLSVQGTQMTLGDWLVKKKKNPAAASSEDRKKLARLRRALRVLRSDDPRAWGFVTMTHGPVLAALLIDREAVRTIEADQLTVDVLSSVRKGARR